MKYHVLTPFSRWFNFVELGDCLKRQGVQWHLLLDEGKEVPNFGSWVHNHYFPRPPDNFFVGHWMVNCFLDSVEIEDESRYIVLTDDDFTEEGFFRKLDAYNDDVLIVSMKRSSQPTPGNGECAFNSLVACPENLRHGSVGFEELVIRGRLMKKYRVSGVYHGDFLFIEQVWNNHMEAFRFVPDAWVYFNYLYPGRTGRWDR